MAIWVNCRDLVTLMKRKITLVKNCCLEMNGCHIKYDLDIIALGSYDVFIGMDWIELHHAILDCCNKSMMCLDEDGKNI